jgi:hypothetical protein
LKNILDPEHSNTDSGKKSKREPKIKSTIENRELIKFAFWEEPSDARDPVKPSKQLSAEKVLREETDLSKLENDDNSEPFD